MIPSLLQIPSAVSDSKLHSLLPNNGKGDFTFDRSTGATRINKDGLIEEVGYFSSELVQNGDFSELGSELVTNGDFAIDSNWNKDTGWNINNGKANCDGSQSGNANIYQAISFTVGKTYKVSFDVSDYVSGTVKIVFGDTGGTLRSANGNYVQYFTFASGSNFYIQGNSSFVGSVDNVSVKQVDPNDRWDAEFYGTDVTITDTLNLVDNGNSGGAGVFQAATIENGKTYKVKFDITASTGSTIVALMFCDNRSGSNQGVVSSYYSVVGSYDLRLTANKDNLGFRFRFARGTGKTVSIDNVSIVEVQGDRPRLSYDITNGVVEDKPHLLLENSSTNLATFSEDFSKISLLQSTITTNNIKSPNGLIKGNLWLANATSNAKELQEQYSVTSGITYTESWFVKYKSLQFIQMVTTSATFGAFYANFDLVNGTKGNSNYTNCSIEAYPDGWYRIQATQVATSTGTGRLGGLRMIASATASRGGNITTDGTEGVYVWGHQVEANSFATSYIPTAGTTITRAAETCNNSKPSVNSTEGVFYAEIAALADDQTGRFFALSDGSSSNRVRLGYQPSVSNRFRAIVVSGGSTTVDMNDTNTTLSDITEYNKIAFKYKVNDFALYFNGTEVKTDTSGAVPTSLNLLEFNNAASTPSSFFYGKVKGLAVYNEALSESQLMQLTGVTASSIYSNFVTRTASFTVEALNEVKKVIDNL